MKPCYYVQQGVKVITPWEHVEEEGGQFTYYDGGDVVGSIDVGMGSYVVKVGLLSSVFPQPANVRKHSCLASCADITSKTRSMLNSR